MQRHHWRHQRQKIPEKGNNWPFSLFISDLETFHHLDQNRPEKEKRRVLRRGPAQTVLRGGNKVQHRQVPRHDQRQVSQ